MEHLLKTSNFGNVHSVYRRTINIEFDGKLAALQVKDSPLSPISLITSLTPSGMENLNVTAGDPVILTENHLEIIPSGNPATGSYLFSYTDSDKYELRLPGKLSRQNCIRLAQNIRSALSLDERGGFQPLFRAGTDDDTSDSSLTLLAAKRHMDTCAAFYYNKSFTEASMELSRLLGLGGGLTPSGDDFLCGTLAGLRFLGTETNEFAKMLSSEIYKRLKDTLDISAAFLSCALEGQYSLAVKQLYQIPKASEIFAGFSEIGHSSGIDTLCGILYILELGLA